MMLQNPGKSVLELLQFAEETPVLTQDQISQANALEIRYRLALDRISVYGHDQVKKAWKEKLAKARQSGSPEDFDEIANSTGVEGLRENYRALRGLAKDAVRKMSKEEVAPFLLSILSPVIDGLQPVVDALAAKDAQQRACFPSLGLLEPSAYVQGAQNALAELKGRAASLTAMMAADRPALGYSGVRPFLAMLGVYFQVVSTPGLMPVQLDYNPDTTKPQPAPVAAAATEAATDPSAADNAGYDPGVFPR